MCWIGDFLEVTYVGQESSRQDMGSMFVVFEPHQQNNDKRVYR